MHSQKRLDATPLHILLSHDIPARSGPSLPRPAPRGIHVFVSIRIKHIVFSRARFRQEKNNLISDSRGLNIRLRRGVDIVLLCDARPFATSLHFNLSDDVLLPAAAWARQVASPLLPSRYEPRAVCACERGRVRPGLCLIRGLSPPSLIRAHHFGEPGLCFALKLTDLYHTPK